MLESQISTTDWWKKQRTNYVYVAMAAGILAFLAFVCIWETFYSSSDSTFTPIEATGSILLLMLRHLLIWVPFLALEIWAFRFLPALDQRLNSGATKEKRSQILLAACVFVCFLPMLLPAILVWTYGG